MDGLLLDAMYTLNQMIEIPLLLFEDSARQNKKVLRLNWLFCLAGKEEDLTSKSGFAPVFINNQEIQFPAYFETLVCIIFMVFLTP